MAESPDHPRRTGAFWLDVAAALTALCVSAASLWVALRTDRTQERLLASSVWPALQFVTSDYVETSDPSQTRDVIRFTVTNAGVGPAALQWFDAYYRGRPVSDTISFLRQCCEHNDKLLLARVKVSNYMQGRVLAARESVHFIEVRRNASNSTAYAVLDKERLNVYVRSCYCSVLDECWLFDSRRAVGKQPGRLNRNFGSYEVGDAIALDRPTRRRGRRARRPVASRTKKAEAPGAFAPGASLRWRR